MVPPGPAFHKPKSFIAAKNLLYASIFFAVVGVLVRDLSVGIENNGGLLALLLTAGGYLIIIFLIKQMGLCKNWARTILLILYIAMFISFVFALRQGSMIGIYDGVILAFQQVLQILALIFLYRKDCNYWFNNSVS
jgi:hypothetical protein